MIVVSNTSPINYLALIERQEILRKLFGRVIIPQTVLEKLQRNTTPKVVREWIANRPDWIEVQQTTLAPDPMLNRIHPGEREAILLAQELHAGALIIDDRDGRVEAQRRGLSVIGTLGVVDKAAERELIDLTETLARLQRTNFRVSPEIIQEMLTRDAQRKR